MKFLVCEKQHGDGCDYTIGCGMRYYFIEAESVEDATEQVIWPEGKDEYDSLHGERALSEILIIPTEYILTIDIDTIKQQIKEKESNSAKEQQEQIDIAELKRLQEKYGVQKTNPS